MSGKKKKTSDKIRKKNIGASALPDDSKIQPAELKTSSGGDPFRKQINSYFEEEAKSEDISKLASSISIGEFYKPAVSGFKGKIFRLISILLKPFHLIYRFFVAPWVGAQERFNSGTVKELQRLINYNKNLADVLADKIERLENKHDVLIAEIVNEHLVRFTSDLVSRMDLLYRKLDESFISHDVDIARMQEELIDLRNELKELRSLLENKTENSEKS